MRVYIEPRDVWVGYYRGDTHHYVCPLPCVVIRWARRDSYRNDTKRRRNPMVGERKAKP